MRKLRSIKEDMITARRQRSDNPGALRAALIESLVDDGELSASELQKLRTRAQAIQYAELDHLLEKWQQIAGGLSAADLRTTTKEDRALQHLWAALSRDQRRIWPDRKKPLLELASEENQLLSDSKDLLTSDASIRRDEYQRLVSVLASDYFSGRQTGTKGSERARAYLQKEVEDTLQIPTTLQTFPVARWVQYDPDRNGLTLCASRDSVTPEVKETADPFLFSHPKRTLRGEVIRIPAPYTADAFAKVLGKIVLFEPEDSEFEETSAGISSFDSREMAKRAFRAGASGVVVATDHIELQYFFYPQDLDERRYDLNRFEYWLNEPTRRKRLMYQALQFCDSRPEFLEGPVLRCDARSPLLEEWKRQPGREIEIRSDLDWDLADGQNILGSSVGSSEPVVLLTAHYDHLGTTQGTYQPGYGLGLLNPLQLNRIMGQRDEAMLEGKALFQRGQPVDARQFSSLEKYEEMLGTFGFVKDPIYNGAVDNASGCATVLLLARLLQNKLPVGVAFFDGEEQGLLGAKALASDWSRYFGNRSLSTLVNFDMPAALDPRYGKSFFLFLGGRKDPLMDLLVAGGSALGAPGYRCLQKGPPGEEMETRSDHAAFQTARFPQTKTVFYAGGVPDTYHSPKDEAPSIDLDKGMAVLESAWQWMRELPTFPIAPR